MDIISPKQYIYIFNWKQKFISINSYQCSISVISDTDPNAINDIYRLFQSNQSLNDEEDDDDDEDDDVELDIQRLFRSTWLLENREQIIDEEGFEQDVHRLFQSRSTFKDSPFSSRPNSGRIGTPTKSRLSIRSQTSLEKGDSKLDESQT